MDTKLLNKLIDEMTLIERYAIEFGKTKSSYKEKLLCIHKDRFYKLIELCKQ